MSTVKLRELNPHMKVWVTFKRLAHVFYVATRHPNLTSSAFLIYIVCGRSSVFHSNPSFPSKHYHFSSNFSFMLPEGCRQHNNPWRYPAVQQPPKTAGVLCTTRWALLWSLRVLGMILRRQGSWLGFFDEYLMLENDISQKQKRTGRSILVQIKFSQWSFLLCDTLRDRAGMIGY